MDELGLVRRLARAARAEPPPRIDVADAVIRRLEAGAPSRCDWTLLAIVSAAAVALLPLAIQWHAVLSDPFVLAAGLVRGMP